MYGIVCRKTHTLSHTFKQHGYNWRLVQIHFNKLDSMLSIHHVILPSDMGPSHGVGCQPVRFDAASLSYI